MNVTSNAARLVSQVLAGEVWPALADTDGNLASWLHRGQEWSR